QDPLIIRPPVTTTVNGKTTITPGGMDPLRFFLPFQSRFQDNPNSVTRFEGHAASGLLYNALYNPARNKTTVLVFGEGSYQVSGNQTPVAYTVTIDNGVVNRLVNLELNGPFSLGGLTFTPFQLTGRYERDTATFVVAQGSARVNLGNGGSLVVDF